MCFFLSHSFVDLAKTVCFGSLSCWNTHPRPIFNALALTVHGPVHRPFDAVQLSCPLSRKTPPKHNVSTSMFDGGDGVLGVIGSIPPSSKQGELSWCQRAGFGLIWPQYFHPVSPLNHCQTSDGPVHVISWAGGPCWRCRISVLHGVVCYQLFSWWLWSQLLEIIDKILPCSPGLIPHRSHDHWNSTRWDLAWSPSLREIDSYFVFLPFANNRTNCCHLLTKLLGDGLVAHSSLVWVYDLVPDIIGQLFGLGHGGEFGIWLIDCFCGQVDLLYR